MAYEMEKTEVQWHPGFCGAAELELITNRKELEFLREYSLSKEPLRMDLLIIKKLSNTPIENEIGYIFKKYNVVEYKSPEDGLSIDDYYKTIGYACLYKGLGEHVDQIPAGELTLSIFRESFPRKLLKTLEKSGSTLEEAYPGIWYVRGNVLFDTQIVVTGCLRGDTHNSLRILSRNAKEADIRAFLTEMKQLTKPLDRNNAEAVLQVSIAANKKLYEKIRRNRNMCEALRDLMKEEINEALAEGRQKGMEEGMEKGIEKGMEKGMEHAILSSIKNLMDTMKLTAEQAMEAR